MQGPSSELLRTPFTCIPVGRAFARPSGPNMGNSVDAPPGAVAYARGGAVNGPGSDGKGGTKVDDPRHTPGGYSLDESDADVVGLRRGDGSFVAAFSAWGATEESIRRGAEEDRAREGRPAERRTA